MKRLIPPALSMLLAFAAPCAFALPGPTSAMFDKGAMFTVDGYAEAEPLVGFPVLVRISDNSPFGFFYDDLHSKTNGDDIAFVGMDGAGLPYEIDTWNTNGTSLFWVRLPTMTNGTQFVMCWGSDSSGRAVCPDKPWADYTGVWHMNETNNAVTTIHDSTGNGLSGTTVSSSYPVAAQDARIGGARHVTTNAQNKPGLDSGITIDLSDSAKQSAVDGLGTEFTASMWVRVTADFNYFYLVSRKSSDGYGAWGVQTLNATSGQVRYYSAGTAEAECASPILATALAAKNQWHKIDFCWKSDGTYVIYQDGANKLTGDLYNQTPAAQGSLNLSLGGSLQNGPNKGGRGLNGDLDEVRLRAFVPSDNWAAADYATVTNETFLTPGSAVEYEVTGDPIAGVQVSGVSYTNATVTATVVSRGGTAASADATIELAASNDFASPLWATNYTVFANNDVRDFAPTGLQYGTTYYVRAVVSNDLPAILTTPPISFTTPTPGSPEGSATFLDRGFTTMAAMGVATAFGTDAQSATMRLEASADADFATVFASPETNATLGATAALVVSGLAPDTTYHLRLRIRNDWGIDTFVALPDATTRAVPFAVTGIGWSFSPDGSTVDVTFGVSGVYDGAEGTAALFYGETSDSAESMGERRFAAPTNLLWSALPVTADPMHATVVLEASLGGQTHSRSWTATIAAGSTAVSVSDFANHQATTNAVLVHAGDVVTLPELPGDAAYVVGNRIFGSLDGNVLTALRPGILGIHRLGGDGTTNTLPVVVLPEVGGDGEIFLFDETCSGNNTFQWANSRSWKKLRGESDRQWPQAPDDVAILALFNQRGGQGMICDMKNLDLSVGAIYAGHFRNRASSIGTRAAAGDEGSRFSFVRTDGDPAILQLCPNTLENGRIAELKFNNNIKLVSYLSETRISGGWDGTDSTHPCGRFTFSDSTTNSIPAGVTVTLVEMDTKKLGAGAYTFSIANLSGGGTFWNRSSGLVNYRRDSTGFTGLIRDSGGHGSMGEEQGRDGPSNFRTATITNAAAEVVGWVPSKNGQDASQDFREGVGGLQTGWPHIHLPQGPHPPWFPARGTTMHGGLLLNRREGSPAWTNSPNNAITRDVRRTDFLDVADGFNYIYADWKHNDGQAPNLFDDPGNDFIADAIRHGNKATLRITDPTRYPSDSTSPSTNVMNVLHGIAAFAVGAGGNCEAGDDYSIVPWIVSSVEQNLGSDKPDKLLFACFDATDRLVRPAFESKTIESFGSTDNAVVWTSKKNGIALAADRTLNSLVLDDSDRSATDKRLGAGRTLSISSGGLVFAQAGAAIGTEDGGAANGSLVLGDAAHPAYVWARGSATAPNEIWAPVTAPGGFVHAYTGTLILGGDQRGIGDELVLNAGTLQLGTTNSVCSLSRGVPIRIFANARLRVVNESSTGGKAIRFDGAAGWFGKVEVANGVAARCKRLDWRDYPDSPEWENLTRGVYGSSASGAEFVRDDLFSGSGTLEVLLDDRVRPSLLIFR